MRDIILTLTVLLFAFLYTTSRKECAGGAGSGGGGGGSGGSGSGTGGGGTAGVAGSGSGHFGGGGSFLYRHFGSLTGQYKENNPNLARRVAGVFMYNSPSDWPFKVSPGTTMAVTGRGPDGIPHV